MIENVTLNYILQKAIQKEIEAQNLYHDLSQKMENEASRDLLMQLVKAETKHEELLQKYHSGELGEEALKSEQILDYRIVEHLNQPEISPDMKLDEILLLAANREKASHEFYLGMAGEHQPGQAKTLFEELASQELEHKQKVEYLYNEVAFPQTAGG